MASRRRRMATDEWSCSLCTLLNHWRDRRCAACDTEREREEGEDEEAAAATPAAPHDATPAMLSEPVSTLRGVFFNSASSCTSRATSTTDPPTHWRNEPRLQVNRRFKRPLRQLTVNSTTSSYGDTSNPPSFSLLEKSTNASEVDVDIARHSAAVVDAYRSSDLARVQTHQQNEQPVPLPPSEFQFHLEPPRTLVVSQATGHVQNKEEEMEEEEEESQPCFQLLGPETAMFPMLAATPTTATGNVEMESRSDSNNQSTNTASLGGFHYQPTSDRSQHAPPAFNLIDMSSSPLPRPKHQTEDRTTAVPVSILQQGFVAASRVPVPAEDEQVIEDKMAQAGLNLSDSDDEEDNNHHQLPSQRKHRLHRNRIQSPQEDEDAYKATTSEVVSTSATWECPVCTNFNSNGLSRCELCDTKREPDVEGNAADKSDRYIDLANSQEEQHAAGAPEYYGFDPGDFENPYAPVPASPVYEDYGADAGAGFDFVEDISDNEAPMAYNCGPTVRPELKEFEHFVCVEDLATDYGCKIDYRQMFGDSKRGKSYADRIEARRRASLKRKREEEARANAPLGPRGKRAAYGAGARKGKQTAAAARRASTGKVRQKKRKSTAAAVAPAAGRAVAASGRVRRASAPTHAGINHYDTSSADFGDGVNTMAWEGVGSAGYY